MSYGYISGSDILTNQSYPQVRVSHTKFLRCAFAAIVTNNLIFRP